MDIDLEYCPVPDNLESKPKHTWFTNDLAYLEKGVLVKDVYCSKCGQKTKTQQVQKFKI